MLLTSHPKTLLPLILLTANLAMATDRATQTEVLDAEGAAISDAFGKALLASVQAATSVGGTEQGIISCQVLAPALAQQFSQQGWKVGRTSLKLRNPSNHPDAWEQAVLERFAQDYSASPNTLPKAVSQTIGTTYRYMRPIAIAKPCLACHGAHLDSTTEATLRHRYPNDLATGYKFGEIRGAFTLSKQLASVPGDL